VKVPPEEADEVNNSLDEVTEYIFEILANSNFAQEVHESFMDLAVGTGCLLVEEGDACKSLSALMRFHFPR
jgi:16S rRNA G966 N2-methylase RsmD